MGAPSSGMKAGEQPAAEGLLTAFKTLSAAERRRHASVLNYWLSVRGDKEFPPLHDLDPLELSDAGPNSVLLELISGGHDAEVRHLGEALREEAWPERIIDAPNPSVLACIAKKLPIVAISRDFLAFEDEYEGSAGKVCCSVTLLPLSAGGAWVDYVYALVSAETVSSKGAKSGEAPKKAAKAPEPQPEPKKAEETVEADEKRPVAEAAEEPVEDIVEEPVGAIAEEPAAEVADEPADEIVEGPNSADQEAEAAEPIEVTGPENEPEPVASAVARAAPGFSKLLDSIAGLTGFYGSQPVKVEPVIDEEPDTDAPDKSSVAEEPVAKEPPAKAPAAEETVVAEPAVAEEPAFEEPAAREQTAHEPAVEEPAAEVRPVEQPVALEPLEPQMAEEMAAKPASKSTKQPAPPASEGSLQNKLTEVRAKADEARMARLRANTALCEGLSAAYDFALDAEEAPEDYLRLVEAQGLKIQLRSPMKPVVKLAFAGMCDEATIKQLEAVLSWAFDEELPRGTLAERVESVGGIGAILGSHAKAA